MNNNTHSFKRLIEHKIVFSLTAALLGLAVSGLNAKSPDETHHPFPDGYGYLKDGKVLSDAVEKGDITPIVSLRPNLSDP
ncbi:hypothetical protein GCM10011332_30440 [Terasakiella brassicae]|uniref:Uncharacterized protein n=1 Tax=Terasakiella brassicae TaxID=1634917 RepID=A0A917FG14_9PROT|nr:hypothetical protein [Terasakiella brassicae]GGF74253.1 hypothetical protein GCM10011332_30440 [Terasakiella brassicae]